MIAGVLPGIFYQFGSFADIFFQWESLGVFDFLLPFLLVFAVVFGILNSTGFLTQHRGIQALIAVIIGLMSLRYQYFLSSFMSELFPRLGIGVTILLAVLILVGLFIAKEETRYWGWGLAAVGGIIVIAVVYQTFTTLGYWPIGGFGTDAVGFLILAVLLLGIIIAVAAGGSSKNTDPKRGIAVWPLGRNGGESHS